MLHVNYLFLGHCVVSDSQQILELRWVNLFILSGDVQGSDTKTLELAFAQFWLRCQEMIYNTDGYVKSLLPHFKLKVKLG